MHGLAPAVVVLDGAVRLEPVASVEGAGARVVLENPEGCRARRRSRHPAAPARRRCRSARRARRSRRSGGGPRVRRRRDRRRRTRTRSMPPPASATQSPRPSASSVWRPARWRAPAARRALDVEVVDDRLRHPAGVGLAPALHLHAGDPRRVIGPRPAGRRTRSSAPAARHSGSSPSPASAGGMWCASAGGVWCGLRAAGRRGRASLGGAASPSPARPAGCRTPRTARGP